MNRMLSVCFQLIYYTIHVDSYITSSTHGICIHYFIKFQENVLVDLYVYKGVSQNSPVL